MENKQDKISRKKPSLLSRKSFLAANVALFAMIGWGLVGQAAKNGEIAAQVTDARESVVDAEEKMSELEKEHDRFEEGMTAETEARLKLNMRRPGEEVVVIRGQGGGKVGEVPADSMGADLLVENESSSMSWFRYFFP